MSDGVELTCPHCSYVGRAKAALPAGAKIRCPRCRGEWTQPTTALAVEPATFEVDTSPKVESGLETRVRKLERRNRVLAVALVGLAALQALGMVAGRRPATSTATGMEIRGELGVGKLTALEVVARRVTVVSEKGEIMGTFDGGAPTGESYATLMLANSESKCTSRLDSDGIDFRDVNGRAQVSLSGGAGTRSSSLAFHDPGGDTLFNIHADPQDVHMVFADREGASVLQMGIRGQESHLEHRIPGSRKFQKLIP